MWRIDRLTKLNKNLIKRHKYWNVIGYILGKSLGDLILIMADYLTNIVDNTQNTHVNKI